MRHSEEATSNDKCDLKNDELKRGLYVSLVCVIICLISYTFEPIGLIPQRYIESTCIVENKFAKTYACKFKVGDTGYPYNYNCGPTENYKVGYYLTEIKSGISKWACNVQIPECKCCNSEDFRARYCFISIRTAKKIGDCYPIITTSLTGYNNVINGSKVACWIDRSGNYLMKDQKSYGRPDIVVISIFLILSCLFACGFLCNLLRRSGWKIFGSNPHVVTDTNTDTNNDVSMYQILR